MRSKLSAIHDRVTTVVATTTGRARAHTAELLEVTGCAGLATSVAGLTHNPWWGGLTGSVILIVFSVLTDDGPPQ